MLSRRPSVDSVPSWNSWYRSPFATVLHLFVAPFRKPLSAIPSDALIISASGIGHCFGAFFRARRAAGPLLRFAPSGFAVPQTISKRSQQQRAEILRTQPQNAAPWLGSGAHSLSGAPIHRAERI